MALDRTWYNTLVDDDGSNTVGSLIEKSDIDALMDDVDDEIARLDTDIAGAGGVDGITDNGTRVTQIAFAATQSASADVNTLDDYEEGTFTAVIGGSSGQSGQTYGAQTCTYTKVGKLVHCYGYVVLTAKGTINGNVQIQGLPFAAATYTAAVIDWQGLAVAKVYLVGRLDASASVITVFGIAAAATSSETNLVTADIGNSTGFIFSVTYTATS